MPAVIILLDKLMQITKEKKGAWKIEYNTDRIWNKNKQEKMSQKNNEKNIHTNLVKGKNKIQSDKTVIPKCLSSHIFQPALWPTAVSHTCCLLAILWSAISCDYCMQSSIL